MYEDDWTAAHYLEKHYAEAVHANDLVTAERHLQELTGMAAPWRDHPHHPANRFGEAHQVDPVPGARS